MCIKLFQYHLEPNWGHIVRVDTRKYAYFAIESLAENRYLMGASFYENWSVEGREAKNRPIWLKCLQYAIV